MVSKIPRDVTERPGAGVSANEAIVDLFMQRAIDLLRLEAGTRDQVIALLNDLEDEIVTQIVRVDPNNGRQQARLAKLLELVRETIRATYRTADIKLAQEVRDVVDAEATWTGRAINAAIRVDFVDVGVTRNQLATLVSDVLIQGAPTKEWWSRQAAGLSQRFSDEMRRGVLLGETNDQLIRRVRGSKTTKGFMDIARNSAERLVRASVQTASNVGREAMYDKNADIIKALKWSATLDTRTSIWCITRDGHLYGPKDHEPLTKGTPPWLEGPGKLHWGCRSTSVPVLKSWKELGIDAPEVPDTTRASMDGQVPADTTFEEWLKKQSDARQNTVLGVGKADLWRRGKITFRDLLDQSGRPMRASAAP